MLKTHLVIFMMCQNSTVESILRYHKVIITSGKLEIFFKPRVSELGACQWKKVSDAMDAAKD